MNVTDLAAELATHARDDVAPTSAPGATTRLAAVRRRSALYRRRRAGGLLVVVLLVALVADVLPKPWLAADRPARKPETVSVLPAFDGDDPLTASAVGRVGQSTLELRFTPTDANLRIDVTCSGGDADEISSTLSLNGHQVGGMSCGGGGGGGFSHSADAARNRSGFAADGVRVGQESVIRLTYDGRAPQRVRLGVGVYQLTGPSTMVGDKRVRNAISSGGKQYRLQAYAAVDLGSGRRTVSLPGRYGDDLLACYGSGGGKGTDFLLVNGRPAGGNSSGGFGCQPLDQGTNRTVGARSSRGATGSLVLALYALRPL